MVWLMHPRQGQGKSQSLGVAGRGEEERRREDLLETPKAGELEEAPRCGLWAGWVEAERLLH